VRKINGCQGVFGKEKTFGNKLILTTGKEKRIKPCAVLVSLVHHFYSAIKTKRERKKWKEKEKFNLIHSNLTWAQT